MARQDLQSVAFPVLDASQIAQLAECAHAAPKHFADGEVLFRVGERGFKFFVVKSGMIEIIDQSGGPSRTVATHGPGHFSGDVSHLTDAPAVVTGVARGSCDVYEVSPETLRRVLNQCPSLSDIILQAFIARRQLLRESPTFTGLRVIGSRYSADTFRVRDFLAKNRILFTWLDLEADPEVNQVLKHFGMSEADTPVVACGEKLLLRNPSNREIADVVGIHRPPQETLYDLAVVGAGPAGLAAAVYGASEGLSTVVLERTAPGGQAGSSMRIENYLGFPLGLTGSELADRATIQANKFGAHLSVSTPVDRLTFDGAYPTLHLEDGQQVVCKCLLIATGAQYRKLDVADCQRYEGRGIFYAATPNEARICANATVIVVGGGNSAGQAAVFLAGHARQVLLVVRGDDLYKNMSAYLARRIEQTGNIDICLNTAILSMNGDDHLGTIELHNAKTGESQHIETPAVFSFIGAVPRTDWLPEQIETDSKGFVLTGTALAHSKNWTARRSPFLLETSRAGVFAAGDARAGSVKRVASAVGEGAMAVQFVHEYLKGM